MTAVQPMWKFVIPGGTTGQVFSKISSADGDYEWSTPSGGGGSPGGSDTQIQFNDSGSFAGSSSMTWDGTNLKLGGDGSLCKMGDFVGSGTNAKVYVDATGAGVAGMTAGTKYFTLTGTESYLNCGGSLCFIGDTDDAGNGMGIKVDDGNRIIKTGDVEFLQNGTRLDINDSAQIVTSNVDIECTDAADGFILTDRTTATRYRLFIDSGVLDIETV